MKRGHLLSVVLTCLVCFGALAGVVAAKWKPLLGLDLRGGLSVVYCPAAKGSTTKCAIAKHVSAAKLDTVVNILDNRANAFGVSQPNINVQGSDVVVQLPGVKNAREVEKRLGATAQLYFRPVLCYAPVYAGPAKAGSTTAPTAPSSSVTTTTATKAGATSTTVKSGAGTTSTTAKSTSTSTSTAATSTTTKTSKATKTSKTKAASSKSAGATPTSYAPPPTCPSVYKPTGASPNVAPYAPLKNYPTTPVGFDSPNSNVLLTEQGLVGERVELGPSQASGEVISSATPSYSSGGQYIIQFSLTKTGTTTWDNLANRNYKDYVGDDLGGVVISAPEINATGAQFGSSGEITGSFTQAAASNLAVDLNYGALPISLNPQTTEVVSPTLGAASLRAGLLAGLLGLLLVMLYTIFYYRALGIVVVLGLVTTAALLYGIISALGQTSFQLTLDLSGVTGLIVSVGITVDSYVVYFERLKDEVRAGRSVRASVDRGFKSAYRTILSADAVSFIGALVLWWLSVGAVRGFAFMLGLSTIIDVITAYFFTRPLVILLGRNRIFTDARHLGVARGLAAASTSEAPA
jgi:preprotein translocase subunit SecD